MTEYEDELGLHNFRARFYDSDLMRFYAIDPQEEFASPYLYCGNNPIIFVDPDGENVYIFGEEEDRNTTIEELNNYSENIEFTLNNGKVIEGTVKEGAKLNEWENKMMESIDSDINTIIRIWPLESSIIVNSQAKEPEEKQKQMLIGSFCGGKIENGQISTLQYLNIGQAKLFDEKGIQSAGASVVHEFLEPYIAAKNNEEKLKSGEMKRYTNSDYDIYLKAHNKAVELDPNYMQLSEYRHHKYSIQRQYLRNFFIDKNKKKFNVKLPYGNPPVLYNPNW